jgi:hypothetical protein
MLVDIFLHAILFWFIKLIIGPVNFPTYYCFFLFANRILELPFLF